ncbi:MAG TPA: hypothetical protein VFN88_06390, partial [Caulobacteraceae bacterium]|nr:hypothetical protein [Caulobacteraceae bacterium]
MDNAEGIADGVDWSIHAGPYGLANTNVDSRRIFDFEKGLLSTIGGAFARPKEAFDKAGQSFDAVQRTVNPWGTPPGHTFA